MKLGRTFLFLLLSVITTSLVAQTIYDVTWENIPSGLAINGNNYALSGAAGNTGVKSCNRNLPSSDGSAEITLLSSIVPAQDGFANGFAVGLHQSNQAINDIFEIKYSFFFYGLRSGPTIINRVYIVINGGIVSSAPISVGNQNDIFIVRREGTQVKFYKNGFTLFSTNSGNAEFHRVGAYFGKLQPGGVNLDINTSFICPYNVNWMNIPAGLTISGDFYNLTGQPVGVKSLNKLQNLENGHVEFTLLQSPFGCDYHIGLMQAANQITSASSIDYNVQINQNSTSVWVNGQQLLALIPPNVNDEFILRRLGSQLEVYINEILVYTSSGIFTGEMRIGAFFLDTPDTGTNIDVDASFPEVPDGPPPPPPPPTGGEGAYIVLKKKLDASYTLVEGNTLNFTYIEDYATNQSSLVECKIYDSNTTFTIPPPSMLPNMYGVNWQTINLPTDLVGDSYYVLEVKDSNKGEVYYLRFKYRIVK
ncbi:MAG: hypothetical protein GC192_20935 [Bacteroidetes bacterium]|nr:hypothetical protein [Bacteroidota bacterium]